MTELMTKLFFPDGTFSPVRGLKKFLFLQRAHRQKGNCGPLLEHENVESLGIPRPAKDLNVHACYLRHS